MLLDQFREQVLSSFGATPSAIKELLEYNRNFFDFKTTKQLPLEDEQFVPYWYKYKAEAQCKGLYEVLQQKLVQLQFPIMKGISQTDYYRSVTLKGIHTNDITEATGLELERPDLLELHMHKTLAGTIPVIIIRNREDFVRFLQALVGKNEPIHIPTSMGACMIAGYNNWDRIHSYRQKWQEENGDFASSEDWKEEFNRLIPRKELYQDCFIVLSDGPYSGICAKSMGITEVEWQEKSLIIRREHECTHYLTRRLFSSMRNNMLDELIADYAGIKVANGVYNADWFLRFIGLEKFPKYRTGARLESYCGNLSDEAFSILQALLIKASKNIQTFEENLQGNIVPERIILALCSLTLEELASNEALKRIELAVNREVL